MSIVKSTTRIPIGHVEVSPEGVDEAVRVLRSGNLRQGDVCARFEAEFAAAVGASHAVTASSGTAALHLSWAALLRPGDEVLVPAFTFIATASSVVLAGGVPVFCDVEPDTGTLDARDAARRVSDRTVGIAPVHLYGGACDVDGILQLAEDRGLRVVWDCAQSHGTRVGGRDVGALPDLACYSFYPSKHITTGEGGMVTTDDGDLAERLRLLRSHGQAAKYHHTLIGLNYRLTDFQAALGRVHLRGLEQQNARRREHAALLTAGLRDLRGLATPTERPGTTHSWHQYTVQVRSVEAGFDRDTLRSHLSAAGVESAVHYPKPLHRQPVFAERAAATSLPVSESLAEQVLSLPVHQGLQQEQAERVIAAVRSAWGAAT